MVLTLDSIGSELIKSVPCITPHKPHLLHNSFPVLFQPPSLPTSNSMSFPRHGCSNLLFLSFLLEIFKIRLKGVRHYRVENSIANRSLLRMPVPHSSDSMMISFPVCHMGLGKQMPLPFCCFMVQ